MWLTPPLREKRTPLAQGLATGLKVKSATMHSDGNLYVQLQRNSEENYVFYVPSRQLSGHTVNDLESDRVQWKNPKPHDQDSEFLPTHVCSNLTTYHDHLILIGTDNEHSYDYAFFVYSPDKKRWMAVADLPLEECLVKQRVLPRAPCKNCLVSLSTSRKDSLLLLGELSLVNSYYHCIVLCVTFQSKYYC